MKLADKYWKELEKAFQEFLDIAFPVKRKPKKENQNAEKKEKKTFF